MEHVRFILFLVFAFTSFFLNGQTGMDCDDPPSLEITTRCLSELNGQIKLTHEGPALIKWAGVNDSITGSAQSDGDFITDLPFGNYVVAVAFDPPYGCLYTFSFALLPHPDPRYFWVETRNENRDVDGTPAGDGFLSVEPSILDTDFFNEHLFEWYVGDNASFLQSGDQISNRSADIYHLKVVRIESQCVAWENDLIISVNEKSGGEEIDFNDQIVPTQVYDLFNMDVFLPGTIDGTPSLRSVDTVFGLSGFNVDIPTGSIAYSMDISNHLNWDARCRILLKDINDAFKKDWTFDFNPEEEKSIHFDFNTATADGDYLAVNIFNPVSSNDPLDIEVDNLTSIDEFYPASIPLMVQVNENWGRLISRSPVPHFILCDPDLILLRGAFRISGGTTPYLLSWDLDEDGMYDDATGNEVIIDNPLPGIHQYNLKVLDAAGNEESVALEIEIQDPREYAFQFPDHSSIDDTIAVIRTCIENGPISVVSEPPGGEITGTGILGDSLFDPSIAGPGTHLLKIAGINECDRAGFAVIQVLEQGNPSWEQFSIAACDFPVDLAAFVTGDTGGRWYIDGVIQDSSVLDPSFLGPGQIEIQYALGLEPCNAYESHVIEIESIPDATLEDPMDSVRNCDPPFYLADLFIDSLTTPGGTWIGGNYIVGDFFDPAGLAPGSYPVIYTVGDGPCLQSDTAAIAIVECTTGVHPVLKENKLIFYPNPVTGIVHVKSNHKSVNSFKITVFNALGNPVLFTGSENPTLDLSDRESGVYLVKVEYLDGSFQLLTLIKM